MVGFKMAVESTLPQTMSLDYLLDQAPLLPEVCNHAKIADWYDLGIQLQLDSMDLDNIRSDTAMTNKLSSMYSLWLNKKADIASRKQLLTALRSEHVGQNRIANDYEQHLRRMVSSVIITDWEL